MLCVCVLHALRACATGEAFTGLELKASGFGAKDLRRAGMTVQGIVDVGYDAVELTNANIKVKDLSALLDVKAISKLGYSLKELKIGGYTVATLKNGFKMKELRDVGFSTEELMRGGCSVVDLMSEGSTIRELKANGVSITEFLSINTDLELVTS